MKKFIAGLYLLSFLIISGASYAAISSPLSLMGNAALGNLEPPVLISDNGLDNVISSVTCDLDATLSESYTSGQTWANVILTPADGTAQTDCDFFVGEDATTTNDPVFVGPAGDPSAHFDVDNTGDRMNIKNNTTLIDNMNIDGQSSWWLVLAFRFSSTANSFISIVSNGGSGAAEEGFEILLGTGTFPIETRFNMTRNNVRVTTNFSSGKYVNGTDYILIVSYDDSTDKLNAWVNSTTSLGLSADAHTETGGDASAFPLMYGVRSNGTGGLTATNGRFYNSSIGNEFLNDTKAAAI